MHVLSAPQLPHTWRQCVEIIIDASWNMHRRVFTAIYPHKVVTGTS